jgi:hypothetical protein
MKRLILACAVLVAAPASAAGSTAALCDAMNADHDGIRCRVSNIDGLGSTLLIRVHARKGDEEKRIARAKIATRQAIDTFIAEGGVYIKMRTTRPDGVEVERTCSKIKGRKSEHCGEWTPVKE